MIDRLTNYSYPLSILGVNYGREFPRANDVFNHYTPTVVTLTNIGIWSSLVIQLN